MSHSAEPDAAGVRFLQYSLGDISLNSLLGSEISIRFTGKITCVNCQRTIKKTFGDGYCFPCFQKLAACDICILKPELCHFRHGTCREPEWGKANCLIPHVVYVANTTGLKVGITREHKKLERWGDQGAIEALVVARVPERYLAGLAEVAIAEHVSDKADWRALLKGQEFNVDLPGEKQRLLKHLPAELVQFATHGDVADTVHRFAYPVLQYLAKATTFNPEKEPQLRGKLQGIRGQYLLIDEKAINIRKYIGYEVAFEI